MCGDNDEEQKTEIFKHVKGTTGNLSDQKLLKITPSLHIDMEVHLKIAIKPKTNQISSKSEVYDDDETRGSD